MLLVFRDAAFEEVLLLLEVHHLGQPGERVGRLGDERIEALEDERDAVLELSYPPAVREPDLSLPLPDLPTGDIPVSGEEPLPPVEPPLPEPTEALSDFWSQGGGSL